jgi:hypothetical protein
MCVEVGFAGVPIVHAPSKSKQVRVYSSFTLAQQNPENAAFWDNFAAICCKIDAALRANDN